MILFYCLSNLNPQGGVDIVTFAKVNALCEIADNQIWLAITENPDTLPLPLSPKVHLVDLGIRYNDNHSSFPWNLLVVLRKRHRHKKALALLLKEVRPDIVVSISNDVSFLPSIKGSWKILREQHGTKKWDGTPTPSFGLKKLVYQVASIRERRILQKNADRIVVLTQGQKDFAWPNNERVVVIPNPTRLHVESSSLLNDKRAIAVGRLSFEKNFSSLVRVWSRVAASFPEWRLDIYGEGGEYSLIKKTIEKENLVGIVSLKGWSSHLEKELLSSSLFVQTSKYESFSLAILEACCCGLPIVAYDCPWGPRSIVKDGENGYLVPPEDEAAMADRICRLIEDSSLRKRMGASAFETSKQYGMDRIVSRWMALFEELCQEKDR
jgi:glycosyltransferase involved in cell wall biosynthesis